MTNYYYKENTGLTTVKKYLLTLHREDRSIKENRWHIEGKEVNF